MRLELEGGKYTYVEENGAARVDRYNEPWRDATGDKFVGALVDEIRKLQAELDTLKAQRLSASVELGPWISAALEDPHACSEFKAAAYRWLAAGMPDSPTPERIAEWERFLGVKEEKE